MVQLVSAKIPILSASAFDRRVARARLVVSFAQQSRGESATLDSTPNNSPVVDIRRCGGNIDQRPCATVVPI